MGKYIKKFDTHSDYEDFIETEDFIRPNVSYCVDNKDVHYNSTQTLFALEIKSGEFISFYFQSGTLYGNTDDGSSALWVLDDDGVVIDNISIYGAERAPILEQINEHFGTSFTGWSDNEIGLRFGDPLPNWNAYEKIELATILIKTDIGSVFAFGVIENSTLKMQGQNAEDKVYVANSDGVIVGSAGNAQAMIDSMVIPRLASQGYNVNVGEIIDASYNEGQTVDNWNDYVIIPK